MEVVVNGKSLGLYSYNDGFELDIPIQSSFMDIALRCNGMTFHIKLPIESQENYTCKSLIPQHYNLTLFISS